jgi:hypothetical protein
LGAQNIVSREPAGRTWMKSPSGGSSTETTFADPPGGTPTAALVNHTVTAVPAANSARAVARSCSDSAATIPPAPVPQRLRALCTVAPTGPNPRDVISVPGRRCGRAAQNG